MNYIWKATGYFCLYKTSSCKRTNTFHVYSDINLNLRDFTMGNQHSDPLGYLIQ